MKGKAVQAPKKGQKTPITEKKATKSTSSKVSKEKARKNPLIEKRPRNFGIGQNIQPKRDLTHFVRWPKYVRLQRQRAILKRRLKVPPMIHQFSRTLDKNTGQFRFLFSIRVGWRLQIGTGYY